MLAGQGSQTVVHLRMQKVSMTVRKVLKPATVERLLTASCLSNRASRRSSQNLRSASIAMALRTGLGTRLVRAAAARRPGTLGPRASVPGMPVPLPHDLTLCGPSGKSGQSWQNLRRPYCICWCGAAQYSAGRVVWRFWGAQRRPSLHSAIAGKNWPGGEVRDRKGRLAMRGTQCALRCCFPLQRALDLPRQHAAHSARHSHAARFCIASRAALQVTGCAELSKSKDYQT